MRWVPGQIVFGDFSFPEEFFQQILMRLKAACYNKENVSCMI